MVGVADVQVNRYGGTDQPVWRMTGVHTPATTRETVK